MRERRSGYLSLCVLVVCFIAIRYPFYRLHQMKDWPLVLFVVSGAVTVISGIVLRQQKLPVCMTIGYGAGFWIGYLLQFDYGAYYNSLWLIWTGCCCAGMLIGIIMEMLSGQRGKE